MTNMNATNFRKNLFTSLDQTIQFNEPINVSTKSGNVVVLSEQDYVNMLATLEVVENPSLFRKVVAGMNTPVEECIPASEVDW